MNVVNTTTRLPTVPGPYQVIIKPANSFHKAIPVGVSFHDGSWHGTDDLVVAWVDPNEEVKVTPVKVEVPTVDNTYTVVLKGAGTNKIGVIKLIRELLGLGLGESKAFVEGCAASRSVIKSGLNQADTDALKAKLSAAGAEFAVEVES